MARFAAGVSYDGRAFSGWQRQPDQRSVQGELERALSQVANAPVTCLCAGRTDAGVHGLGQVMHWDSTADRRPDQWLRGVNTWTGADVKLTWVRRVSNTFHARFSAQSRRYAYRLLCAPIAWPLEQGRACWVPAPLVGERMVEAGQYWLGEHDFSAFRAKGCQSNSVYRRVMAVEGAWESSTVFVLHIEANAFLYHMVRMMVGVLLRIGTGRAPVTWAQEVLMAGRYPAVCAMAPPHGLYLESVGYPEGVLG